MTDIPQHTLDSFSGNEYRARVYLDRYAWNGEETWRDTVDRIVNGLKGLDEYSLLFSDEESYRLCSLLDNMVFLPGGRIIHTVGTDIAGTLYNCVTLPRPHDSIEGIMTSATEIATCLKRGAGVGIRLDSLRPAGSPVTGSRGHASGSTSFGTLFNAVAGTISQGGTRRGAMLFGHRFNHPDILDFINAKRDLTQWQNVNTTVFMDEEDWAGRKDSPAWQALINSAHATGEPGLLFMNTAQRVFRGTPYGIPFEGVNACSEVLLPAYGCCLLGALNLTNAYTLVNLESVTSIAIRFLHLCHLYAFKHDMFPLPQSREITQQTMKIGLGVMGLTHGLIMEGQRYGSKESLSWVSTIFHRIKTTAYHTSKEIYDKLNMTTPWGRANLDLLSCPPTGTISRLAGTTNGIEPIFRLRQLDRNRIGEFIVEDPLYTTGHYDPALFVDSSTIHPLDRVKMQAAIQQHLDNAISSTVNLPADATPEDVENIFTLAHDLGCVSITVYRDGSRENVYVPLPTPGHPIPVHPDTPLAATSTPTRFQRPLALHGTSFKFTFGNANVYITVNYDDEDQPREVFVNAPGINEAWSKATTILISRLLQLGDDPGVIAGKLSRITNSDVTCFVNGHCIPSQPAAVGFALEWKDEKNVEKNINTSNTQQIKSIDVCPACGQSTLQRTGHCTSCTSCTYTTCD